MVLWSIKIGPTAYDVSKTLLCSHSPYFAGMLNGKFKEGQEQSVVLEEIKGVVLNQSFRLFLQWLYLGRVILGKKSPKMSLKNVKTESYVRIHFKEPLSGKEEVFNPH
jgi:hypothetical protein